MNNFAFIKTIPIERKIKELFYNIEIYKLNALIKDSLSKCFAIDYAEVATRTYPVLFINPHKNIAIEYLI